MPSDWDGEEEYIYDDDYELDEEEVEDNENEQLDEFDKVDEDKITDLSAENGWRRRNCI